MFGIGFGDDLLVGCVAGVGLLCLFEIRTMIDKGSDLNAIGKLSNSSDVVLMVVRDYYVIDLLKPCRFCR
jgi:hypothetical protein